jgi:hypothetical protein
MEIMPLIDHGQASGKTKQRSDGSKSHRSCGLSSFIADPFDQSRRRQTTARQKSIQRF